MLPCISEVANIIKFPSEWPSKVLSSDLNRYWKIFLSFSGISLNEMSTFRMSPGGTVLNIFRSSPLLPPSSATVTIAVTSASLSFRLLKITGNPVPPPITVIFGRDRLGRYTFMISPLILSQHRYPDVLHLLDSQQLQFVLTFFRLMLRNDDVLRYNLSRLLSYFFLLGGSLATCS